MVICLERSADLPLTISALVKSRLVLPFWYQLTRVLPDKGPLHEYVCNIGYCLNGLFSVNNAVMYGCNTNLHAM